MRKSKVIVVFSLLLVCFFPIVAFSALNIGLDLSFGKQGQVSTALGSHEDRALASVLQADGKIVVAGSSSNSSNLDFALARYNSDGSLDTSFSDDGQLLTPVGRGDDVITALIIDSKGRIVAGGYSDNGVDRDFALVRYLPDGSLDRDFGLEGIVTMAVGSGDDAIAAMVSLPNDGFLVAGQAEGTAGRVVVLARYGADGTPDGSFGQQGIELLGIGSDALVHDMAVASSGSVYLSGTWSDGAQPAVMLLRVLESGQLDATFGNGGIAAAATLEEPSEGLGLSLLDDGSILVAGSVGAIGKRDAALFSFTGDGQHDSGFGVEGVLVTAASTGDDALFAVDQGDFPVAVGYATDGETLKFLQISYPGVVSETETKKVATSSPATSTATNTSKALRIADLQVVDSYARYVEEKQSAANEAGAIVPEVLTTSFGSGDAVGYDMVLQEDGKVVAVGYSEESGVSGFALARYNQDATSAGTYSESGVDFIATIAPFEVTRTGAFSGGYITPGSGSFTKRGVVFSIAPYPVLLDNVDGGGAGGGGGSTGPAIVSSAPSGTLDAGTTSTTLEVETDVAATCRYATESGTAFSDMTVFSSTGSTLHSQTLTGLEDGGEYSYFVLCQDTNLNTSAEATISFSVASATAGKQIQAVPRLLGNFLVGEALAADTTSTVTTTDSNTGTTASGTTTEKEQWVREGSTTNGSGTGRYSSILEDLQPGTFYYVRAYAVSSSGTVYYGNQVGFRTADSCFIATAAYGSFLHPQVQLLREFRDSVLMQSATGRCFVRWYNTHSPAIADQLASSPVGRVVVRILLLPCIALAWLVQQAGLGGAVIVILLCLVPLGLSRYSWRRVT